MGIVGAWRRDVTSLRSRTSSGALSHFIAIRVPYGLDVVRKPIIIVLGRHGKRKDRSRVVVVQYQERIGRGGFLSTAQKAVINTNRGNSPPECDSH